MKIVVLMILLMISTKNSFAQAVALNKGDIASFKGVLITEEQLKSYDKSERLVPELKQLNDLHDLRHELYKKELSEARSEINKARFKGYVGTVGGFLLGVIITGVAARAAIEATK